jgi:nucleoside transporter
MTGTESKNPGHFISLSIIMFVIFFTWGAWFAGIGRFMSEAGMGAASIGWAYSTTPIAAIVTPFFIGIVADRFINAEKLQGTLLLLSCAFMAGAPSFATAETSTVFLLLLFLHTLCFMPTLSLSNTIALKHLTDSEKNFPRVAVFRTLGWIVAGLSVSFIFHYDTSSSQCYVAAGAALVAGIYSFFLPATPPTGKDEPVSLGDIVGAGTFHYFGKFSFSVFMFISLLICVAFMPYWANLATFLGAAGIEKTTAFQTWGQIAEVPVLLFILPFFLKKFGIKWTFALGIVCWIARYAIFSTSAGLLAGENANATFVLALLLSGVLLHGFSYDFVFISGYLYVDRHVDETVRAQAQGLLTVFTQGIAFLISSQLFVGYYFGKVVQDTGNFSQWKEFWLLPVTYLVVILILFVILFKDKKEAKAPEPQGQ